MFFDFLKLFCVSKVKKQLVLGVMDMPARSDNHENEDCSEIREELRIRGLGGLGGSFLL